MFFDFIGALASILATLCFIRLNRMAWPLSLVACLINGALYWKQGIYADMMLEAGYFLSSCYGWYYWSYQSNINTRTLPLKGWVALTLGASVLFCVLHWGLTHLTHSNVAGLDALTTSLSLCAQLLMCYKMIATWVVWFIADALYVGLYLQKQLPFHALQMMAYTSLAVMGYYTWLKNKGETLEACLPLTPKTQ